MLTNKEVLIFDFDGVIIDSMDVRDFGFYEIFKEYDISKVEELIKYHRINGGLSRFNKIKYFYENILGKEISEEEINEYANEFSKIMREELTKKKYLIKDCIEFLEKRQNDFIMHIASGSEQNELKYLCEGLGIKRYFTSIHGSPTHKNQLVKEIIEKNNYLREKVVMIGDSINDLTAAEINDIDFIGYNNIELKKELVSYAEDLNIL